MSNDLVKFSEVITREEFKSGRLYLDTQDNLRMYFEWVKERFDSGEQYPYDLEELVGVALANKQDAIKALEKDFTQPVDFAQIMVKRDDKSSVSGYRSVKQYRLTPLAFEFMVARRCKPVFEIYHKVFHAAVNVAKTPVTSGQMFMEVAKQFLELENRLFAVESSQQRLEDRVNEALPRDSYLTILGFCSKYHVQLSAKERQDFGKDAGKLCRQRGLLVDRVPDKRYGTVGAYPEEILLELCEVS